jgi:hypothetical protein
MSFVWSHEDFLGHERAGGGLCHRVTEDKGLLALRTFEATSIVTPWAFADAICDRIDVRHSVEQMFVSSVQKTL